MSHYVYCGISVVGSLFPLLYIVFGCLSLADGGDDWHGTPEAESL